MTTLRRAIADPYRGIMDPSVNPLMNLPASQRFHDVDGDLLRRHRCLALVRAAGDFASARGFGSPDYRSDVS